MIVVGETISHYRVLGKLGSGGMGVVYEAEDLTLGRHVALKFLHGDVVHDQPTLDRFNREARDSGRWFPRPQSLHVSRMCLAGVS